MSKRFRAPPSTDPTKQPSSLPDHYDLGHMRYDTKTGAFNPNGNATPKISVSDQRARAMNGPVEQKR